MQRRNRILATGAAIGALLAAAISLVGCGGSSVSTVHSPPGGNSFNGGTTPAAIAQAQKAGTSVDPAIVAADNSFGLSLLDTLLPGDNGDNIAISPLSVALALQVTYNGAVGQTQIAMARTLQLGALSDQALNSDNAALQASLINPDPNVQLTIANSPWIDQTDSPVLPSFTQTDENYYGATIGDLAGAPDNVNAWVDSETHGLIPTILPPGSQGEYRDAIIANVLYFKGSWTTSFDPSDTVAAPFTLSGGSVVSAKLMHQTGPFEYTEGTLYGSNFQAARIPYGQGRLDMVVVLPAAGVNVTSFVAAMTMTDLTGVIAQLQPSTITIALPRFSASYGAPLIPALTTLGMGVAFGQSADFSALAPRSHIGVVVHKTVVEIDETGTVAAAVTAVGITSGVVGPPPVEMTMDHPFFYAIEDSKTGELLFIGLLMNPSGG
jgi:serine protease inhibitor